MKKSSLIIINSLLLLIITNIDYIYFITKLNAKIWFQQEYIIFYGEIKCTRRCCEKCIYKEIIYDCLMI